MTELGIPTARAVHHVGVTVPDLDEAIEFFTEVLGGECLYVSERFEDPDTDWMESRLGVNARASLVLAMIRLGPTLQVELFEYEAPDQRRSLQRNSDIGASHIAIYVDDVEAAERYLRGFESVRVLYGSDFIGPEHINGNVGFFYFESPWGMTFEIFSVAAGQRMPFELEGGGSMAPLPPTWTNRNRDLAG